MKNQINRLKSLFFILSIFILYSCSWFHSSQVAETAAPGSRPAESPKEPAQETAPAQASAAPAAAPAPSAPPAAPAEAKAEPAKPPAEKGATGSGEVDFSHITLAPGPDERPLTREEVSKIPPSEAIYLSGRGVMAGKGDAKGLPPGEANRAGGDKHPLALEVSDLPKDQYGLVNWADALRQGKITPKPSVNPEEADMPPFDLSFDIPTKSNFMPNVVFPHKIHTMWLTCTNCHPAIFLMNHAENNKNMTMPKIAAGEFCGRCHNRVAFPLSDCLRCHVVPKEADKFEGTVIPGMGDVSMELCGNKGIGCPPSITPPK